MMGVGQPPGSRIEGQKILLHRGAAAKGSVLRVKNLSFHQKHLKNQIGMNFGNKLPPPLMGASEGRPCY